MPNRRPGSALPANGLRSRQFHDRKTTRGCGGSSLLHRATRRTRLPPFEEARRTALRTTPRSPPLAPGEAVRCGSLRHAVRRADSRSARSHRESRRTRRSQPRPGSRGRVPRLDHPRTITHESRHSGPGATCPRRREKSARFPSSPPPSLARPTTRIAHLPRQSTTATAGRRSPCGPEERPTLGVERKRRGSRHGNPALPADWMIAYTHASTAETPRREEACSGS